MSVTEIESAMRSVAGYFLAPLKFVWALPWTVIGIAFGLVAILTGGRMRIGRGVVEFWGGAIDKMLPRLPLAGGAAAITFGHTILARTRDDLESCREHELVHVRQYERWGPLFIPAYLLCSLVLWLRRKSAYFDNPFEQEAYGAQNTFVNQSRVWLNRLICLALVAAVCGLLAGCLSRTWWVWELATHFRVIYLLGLAIVALLLWITGRFWRSIFVGVVSGWIGVGLIPFYWPTTPPPPTSPVLRVLATNVLSKNSEYDRALNLVRRESPDVFVAMEVNASWRDRLAELSSLYPYQKMLARPDNFGIALFSRLTLEQITVVPLGDSGVPSILAQVAVGGRRLSIFCVHVLPPMGSSRAAERNASLVTLAELVREQSGDVLVIGDLNCTSWSPYFDDLLTSGNLRDSRVGFGLQPSWPVMPGLGPILPIDHCLVSSGVILHSRRLGSAIGSDHLPIVVDVSLRTERGATQR